MSKEIKKITGYNLKDFIDKIIVEVKQGYEISDTNAGYPQSWGPGLYTCDVEKSTGGATETKVEEPKTEAPVEASEPDSAEDEPKPTTRRRRKTSK